MNFDDLITRRETLKRLITISGVVGFYGASGIPFTAFSPAQAKAAPRRFIIEGIGQTEGYSIKELATRVFDAAGGMKHFVSKGDVVAIKPNISWARQPALAATTNPVVLEAVIELCYEAGAKKVRIVDNTINDVRRCFAITGAGTVAKKTNADLVFPSSSLMRRMKINGDRLDVWPVFTPLIEADKLINLPIAKTHSLSSLTLGIKNWIGGVGGRRYALHQDIHRTIVDLAQFFKPTVTLIDAISILVKNGPSGGSPSDVAMKNTLILSDDPVAADACAARLFGYSPDKIGFISLGEKSGLGTKEFLKLDQKKVIV
ncbi:MAG: DUF362 domain-containing protein [Deltaproteobacteria bacterium]|nr:MAG: DUF362 domain-containing protein [Deltaproteobacteria bacterium]